MYEGEMTIAPAPILMLYTFTVFAAVISIILLRLLLVQFLFHLMFSSPLVLPVIVLRDH